MRAPLLLIPLSIEWLILITTVTPLVLSGRFRKTPRFAIVLWFSALLSAAIAAAIAVFTSLWSIFVSWQSLNAGLTQATVFDFLVISFGPWIMLAVAGISIALINMRIEPLISVAQTRKQDIDYASTRFGEYKRAILYEFALPQVFAMSIVSSGEWRILVSKGARDLLTEDEMNAVLAHEYAHLSQRHNQLKRLARFVRLMSERLAASKALVTELDLLCEEAADQSAARAFGQTALLAAQAKF